MRHTTSAHHRATTRRALFQVAIVPLALALVFSMVIGIYAVDAQENETPVAGVLGEADDSIDCNDSPADASVMYSVVSEESEASYRADEEIAGQGAVTAIGTTNAIIGEIFLDDAGLPMRCSQFAVDLRTLESDSTRRDNHLYTDTLETETYPLAVFVLTSVEGDGSSSALGEEVEFLMIGNLTMHGETRQVAWEVVATVGEEQITGIATTSFDMPEFNIEAPVVGQVLSIDENIALEVILVAR